MPAATVAAPPVDLEEVGRLRAAVMRLHRRLRQNSGTDITPTQLSVLANLERHGPMTLSELATREAVRPPSITRTTQNLLDQGLVRREAVVGDRRVVVIRLSPEGRRLVQAIRNRRTAWLADRVARLSDSDRAGLRAAIAAIEAILEDPR